MIKRDSYLKKLIDRMDNGLIKVITGIRKCGKSYLLFNIFYEYLKTLNIKENQIIKIALDNNEFYDLRNPELLEKYIKEKIKEKNKKYYIFIDEIQLAITLEEIKAKDVRLYYVLNGLNKDNIDIYITGSNSKMLTKDVLTIFRGRADEIRIHPLSFKEYYEYINKDKVSAYEEYSLYGGLPKVLDYKKDEDKENYLKNLFNFTYFKDIEERYDISHSEILNQLCDDLYSSIGSLTNSSKISRSIKSNKNINISSVTISKYLEYLKESFLFNEAKRYDIKGKKYFEYPSKYYSEDIGLRNARLNFKQNEPTHIMENIIYNELINRGYSVDIGVVEIIETVNGEKKKKSLEIDFVINKGFNRIYIQSAFDISNDEKRKAELKPFKHCRDHFKKIIITVFPFKPFIDEEGILHLSIYDFLLDEYL